MQILGLPLKKKRKKSHWFQLILGFIYEKKKKKSTNILGNETPHWPNKIQQCDTETSWQTSLLGPLQPWDSLSGDEEQVL